MNQEEYLRWLDINDVAPFHFERLDRDRLSELCDDNETIIEPLEFCVLDYKLATVAGQAADTPPDKKRLLREVNALRTASRKLLDEIGTVHPYVRRGIVSPALRSEHIDDERFVGALYLIEHEARWWLDYQGDSAMVRGRGRPRSDPSRPEARHDQPKVSRVRMRIQPASELRRREPDQAL